MKVSLADLHSKGWGKRMMRVSLMYLGSTEGGYALVKVSQADLDSR